MIILLATKELRVESGELKIRWHLGQKRTFNKPTQVARMISAIILSKQQKVEQEKERQGWKSRENTVKALRSLFDNLFKHKVQVDNTG